MFDSTRRPLSAEGGNQSLYDCRNQKYENKIGGYTAGRIIFPTLRHSFLAGFLSWKELPSHRIHGAGLYTLKNLRQATSISGCSQNQRICDEG
jgi:hypothetical protein